MKKIGSKLFEKFEDSKILNETSLKIFGGDVNLSIAPADPTTNDCTIYGGSTDCGDVVGTYPKTKEYQDYVMTSSTYDTIQK